MSRYRQDVPNQNRNEVFEEETAEVVLVIPPNGCYGWLVTFCSFLISFLVDGGLYTFGIFLHDISDTFHVEPTRIAITSSIMTGFNFGLGPICCALVNRYGFRKVTIFGGIMLAGSLVGATFLKKVELFIVVVGGIGGAGSCFLYQAAFIVVGFYFEKWRALATSITACGSSIGMIAFPPIFAGAFRNYTWQNKFYILAGCYVFCCVLCLTFKPVTPVKLDDTAGMSTPVQQAASSNKRYRSNKQYPTVSQASVRTGAQKTKKDADDSYMVEAIRGYMSTATIGRASAFSMQYSSFYGSDEDIGCCKKCYRMCYFICCLKWCECFRPPEQRTVHRPMYRDDVFYNHSVHRLPQYRSRIAADEQSMSIAYNMSVTRMTTTADLEEQFRCVCCAQAVRRTVATMLDFGMLKLPSFVLVAFSGFFVMLGVYSPFIFITDKAIDMKIDENDAVLLLSFIGIANAIGRITCGIVSFFPVINARLVIIITLIICGGSIIVSNYFPTYLAQAICVVIFGLFLAAFFAIRTVMLVDLYGLENLTNCFGVCLLFQGLGNFGGVPLASVLREQTGSYNASFIMVGCFIIFSGLLLLPVARLAKRERANKKIPSYK